MAWEKVKREKKYVQLNIEMYDRQILDLAKIEFEDDGDALELIDWHLSKLHQSGYMKLKEYNKIRELLFNN